VSILLSRSLEPIFGVHGEPPRSESTRRYWKSAPCGKKAVRSIKSQRTPNDDLAVKHAVSLQQRLNCPGRKRTHSVLSHVRGTKKRHRLACKILLGMSHPFPAQQPPARAGIPATGCSSTVQFSFGQRCLIHHGGSLLRRLRLPSRDLVPGVGWVEDYGRAAPVRRSMSSTSSSGFDIMGQWPDSMTLTGPSSFLFRICSTSSPPPVQRM